MSKQRLDILLVSRNLVESRELAQRLIIAGEVSVGGHPSTKPGLKVNEDADITIRNRPRYVSRGGLKMEGALNAFPVSAEGKVCLDIGASTGGFTDCLLQHGAARVHAIDVGTNQLVWKLRQDPRVIVKEKFNARYMTPEDIGEQVDLIVSDVSFISLKKILPAAFPLLKKGGDALVLIKPQFEAGTPAGRHRPRRHRPGPGSAPEGGGLHTHFRHGGAEPFLDGVRTFPYHGDGRQP